MRVFVTGGTGFIGSRLTRRLLAAGHEVRVLTRRPISEPPPEGAVAVPGDLADRAAITAGMEGCDAVVHLAACYSFWTLRPAEYQSANVDGVRTVMECALAANVPKVVHVSSMVVYAAPRRGRVDESAQETSRPLSWYAATKQQGDHIAWELHRNAGLPLVVVYPGAVLGEDDPKSSGEYLSRLLERRLPASVFDSVRFPWVDVRDVAEILARAAERDGTIGRRYFAVSESLTFGEINRLVAEISGVPSPRLRMPNAAVMPLATILTGIATLSRRPPLLGMAADQMRTMKAGADVDGSRAARELGVTYSPIRSVLERVIRHQVSQA